MSSQSQPPIPPVAGLRDTPGPPDSGHSAPSADSGEDRQGVVTIQDTEVIDATGMGVPGTDDAESYAAGEHDSDRVNDPRT